MFSTTDRRRGMASRLPAGCLCRRSASSAFSLVEMMITFGLTTLVGTVVAATTIYAARSFQAMGNYADLNRASRQTLDIMSRDIRQAKVLTSFATNQLVFTDLTNGTFSYTWDPQAGTLIRVYNGQTNLLLGNCDSLAFHISQRTPSNNFTFWPATAAANAKLIDVTWNCSRKLLGAKANTELSQTAKITIRN